MGWLGSRLNGKSRNWGLSHLSLFQSRHWGGISTYEVVHQIAKRGSNIEARDRRFDVTLLINGLPIVQIELKQVTAKDGVYQAFNQIKSMQKKACFEQYLFDLAVVCGFQ